MVNQSSKKPFKACESLALIYFKAKTTHNPSLRFRLEGTRQLTEAKTLAQKIRRYSLALTAFNKNKKRGKTKWQ